MKRYRFRYSHTRSFVAVHFRVECEGYVVIEVMNLAYFHQIPKPLRAARHAYQLARQRIINHMETPNG